MTSMEIPSSGTSSSMKKMVPERLGTMSKRHNMQLSQSAISKKKVSSERQWGFHKKQSLSETSNSKPRAEPSLHSVRSLLVGFRSTDGSLQEEEAIDFSELGEGKEDSNVRNKVESSNLGVVIEEGGANLYFSFENDVNGFRTNGDSPYGSKSAAGNSPVEASSLSDKFLS